MSSKPILKLFRISILWLMLALAFGASAAEEWVYTVKPGENLWQITEDFLVNTRYWRRLQRLNKIADPHHVLPGTKLIIPLKWTRFHPSKANVTRVSGTASVVLAASAKQVPVTLGMELNTGDRIRTEGKSSVTLVFEDGSQLVLRENSDLKLEKIESFERADAYRTQLRLNRGRSVNKVNPYKKPGSRFEIATPSATAAVRGTHYRVTAESQKTTTTEVLDGKVRVGNDLGQVGVPKGYGTVAQKDLPPSPPVELLPPPDLSGLPKLIERLPLKFEVGKVDGAVAYRTQITQDPAFQKLAYNKVSPTNQIKVANLPDGKYLIRVRGIDPDRLEGYDELHEFTLNARPEPPLALMPKPDAALPMDHRKFSWTGGEGITSYHFQLDDTPDFKTPLVDKSGYKETTLTLDRTLTPGTWYWRIAAIDPKEGMGPFGDPNRFRIRKSAPKAEADLSDEGIVFRWPADEGEGYRYRIQVARDKSFANPLVDETITEAEYTLQKPEQPGTLFMRVKVIEKDGFEGDWSRPQTLVIPFEPGFRALHRDYFSARPK